MADDEFTCDLFRFCSSSVRVTTMVGPGSACTVKCSEHEKMYCDLLQFVLKG